MRFITKVVCTSLKVGFLFMLVMGLLGMHFDAAVVFATKSLLFFRLAVAILCIRDNQVRS